MTISGERLGEMGSSDPRIDELLRAANRGETALVVEFLRSGIDPNVHETGCTTALLMASRNGHVATMRVLLEHGAHPNPDGSRGYTALTHAIHLSLPHPWDPARRTDPEPMKLLLAAGAGFNLIDAVLLNDRELVGAMLDKGADPNEGEWSYSGPPLMEAAAYGHVEMVDLLLDRGAEIEAKDDLSRTALREAATYGQSGVVRRLLDRGAEINPGYRSKRTALSDAAEGGHSELVEYLLARGARWTFMDAFDRGDIPLFVALLDERIDAALEEDLLEREGPADDPDRVAGVDLVFGELDRIAMEAVGRGDPEIVRLMLDRDAAHFLNWQDEHSLLAEASRRGHLNVARLLIEDGADFHVIGRDELTPLAWARKEGRCEIVELLKQAGAER